MVGTPRIRYEEGCAAAVALSIVGDRWGLLVVRELTLRPKRFTELRAGLPGITASVLSARLAALISADVIVHDEQSGRYALTASGLALRPILHELGRWGVGRPEHDPTKFLSPTAFMLSLDVMVDPEAAQAAPSPVGLDLGHEQFQVSFHDGVPDPQAVDKASGVVVFHGEPGAVAGALYGPAPVAATVAAGAISLSGDGDAAQRFADAFSRLG